MSPHSIAWWIDVATVKKWWYLRLTNMSLTLLISSGITHGEKTSVIVWYGKWKVDLTGRNSAQSEIHGEVQNRPAAINKWRHIIINKLGQHRNCWLLTDFPTASEAVWKTKFYCTVRTLYAIIGNKNSVNSECNRKKLLRISSHFISQRIMADQNYISNNIVDTGCCCFATISTSEVGVIERFGKFDRFVEVISQQKRK